VSEQDAGDGAELARLLAPRPPLGLPIPAYGGRSLPNVTSSVVRATGVRLADGPPIVPPLADDLDPFEGRRAEGTIVVLLVDAMGWLGFAAWRRGADGADAEPWAAHARPITSVFSTTTTAALVSLSTAAPPGRTGVPGYRQYLPAFGVVADVLRMIPLGVKGLDLLVGPEWTPSTVSGVPTLFRRGLPAAALSRDRFEGTGFTRLLYDGAEYVPYSTAVDFAHSLARLLGRANPPPVVFAYWDELDTIQHLHGPGDDVIGFELAQFARTLRYVHRHLSPALRRGTRFLITGDHGQVPARLEDQLRLDQVPEVLSLLARPPAGDRRAGFLYARPGQREALERALAPRLPAGSRQIPMRSAIEAGLFGPPPHHPELEDRLGDLLVLVPSPSGLTYQPPGAPVKYRHLYGAHGGLEPAELVVPLVTGTLEELGGPAP
jgi:hypothetical protein